MDFFNCISLSKARQIIKGSLKDCALPREKAALLEALGRVAACDITAADDLPAFNRSTVDGYAVRSRDTFAASEGVPALLELVGEVVMGQAPQLQLGAGQAAIIPTGGMLPDGADAVIMIEHTEQPEDSTIAILKAVSNGENVVQRGEDAELGAVVINKGRRINPADIGLLAACGCNQVDVVKRPRVAVISTGDEIVGINMPPQPGQVRDINSYALVAALTELGCDAKVGGVIGDDFNEIYQAMAKAATDYDLVIISGGSSVGVRDHTVKVIEMLGKPGVLFYGVAVKPGKPTIFGLAGRVPVFGLPGHPAAALTVFRQLVQPALAFMLGVCPPDYKAVVTAALTRNLASVPGRDDFIRVRLLKRPDGYYAEPVLGKSGLIHTMTKADGVVHIPSGDSGLYAGDMVEVELLNFS